MEMGTLYNEHPVSLVLTDQLTALPCVPELGISPSLRHKEKLDVHRDLTSRLPLRSDCDM